MTHLVEHGTFDDVPARFLPVELRRRHRSARDGGTARSPASEPGG